MTIMELPFTRHLHKKRGSTYRALGYACVQADRPLSEGSLVMVYLSEKDGSFWVRPADEFGDGRFEALEPKAQHAAHDPGTILRSVNIISAYIECSWRSQDDATHELPEPIYVIPGHRLVLELTKDGELTLRRETGAPPQPTPFTVGALVRVKPSCQTLRPTGLTARVVSLQPTGALTLTAFSQTVEALTASQMSWGVVSRHGTVDVQPEDVELILTPSGPAVAVAPTPIPMRLHCPACYELHIDLGEFATRPHHTHACQACGNVWRPAIMPTVGVRFLPGFWNDGQSSAK